MVDAGSIPCSLYRLAVRSFDAGAPSTNTTANRHETTSIRRYHILVNQHGRSLLNGRRARDKDRIVTRFRALHDEREGSNAGDKQQTMNHGKQPEIHSRPWHHQTFAKFLCIRTVGCVPFSDVCALMKNSEVKWTPPCCNANIIYHTIRLTMCENIVMKQCLLSIAAKFPSRCVHRSDLDLCHMGGQQQQQQQHAWANKDVKHA